MAVGEHGVPVPRPVILEPDERWLGAPFLVMPRVDGHDPGELPVADPWVVDRRRRRATDPPGGLPRRAGADPPTPRGRAGRSPGTSAAPARSLARRDPLVGGAHRLDLRRRLPRRRSGLCVRLVPRAPARRRAAGLRAVGRRPPRQRHLRRRVRPGRRARLGDGVDRAGRARPGLVHGARGHDRALLRPAGGGLPHPRRDRGPPRAGARPAARRLRVVRGLRHVPVDRAAACAPTDWRRSAWASPRGRPRTTPLLDYTLARIASIS